MANETKLNIYACKTKLSYINVKAVDTYFEFQVTFGTFKD